MKGWGYGSVHVSRLRDLGLASGTIGLYKSLGCFPMLPSQNVSTQHFTHNVRMLHYNAVGDFHLGTCSRILHLETARLSLKWMQYIPVKLQDACQHQHTTIITTKNKHNFIMLVPVICVACSIFIPD